MCHMFVENDSGDTWMVTCVMFVEKETVVILGW